MTNAWTLFWPSSSHGNIPSDHPVPMVTSSWRSRNDYGIWTVHLWLITSRSPLSKNHFMLLMSTHWQIASMLNLWLPRWCNAMGIGYSEKSLYTAGIVSWNKRWDKLRAYCRDGLLQELGCSTVHSHDSLKLLETDLFVMVLVSFTQDLHTQKIV